MSGDEEFVRHLRAQADAAVPAIEVSTVDVVPRARRRRTVRRTVGAVAAVAVLGAGVVVGGSLWGGRTTTPPAQTPPVTAVPTPPAELTPVTAERRLGLIDMWRVAAEGEGSQTWLRLAPGEATVWRECGFLSAGWAVGETAFAGGLVSWNQGCGDSEPEVAWLDAARWYQPDGDGWRLLDASGAVVATLRHDGLPEPHPDVLPEYAQPPAVDEAAAWWLADPAAVPDGLTPASAGAVLGRWEVDNPVPTDPYVELSADGTWRGSDGCNESAGRWAVDRDGWFLVTSGARTEIGCDGAPLPDLLATARRLAFDADSLVLLDQDGVTVGELAWAGGSPAPEGSATLTVTCTEDALFVAGEQIVATSTGVAILVQNDGAPAGTYLNLGWQGGGQGDELPTTPTQWLFAVPPGDLQIGCSNLDVPEDESPWPVVTVQVVDPEGLWDPTTIQDLGCAGNVVPGWAIRPADGKGPTPQAAVEDLLPAFGTGPAYRVERSPGGYPDSPVETWLVHRDGVAYATVVVHTDGIAGYQAYPDRLCVAP